MSPHHRHTPEGRRAAAERIAANPQNYKVCVACESICGARVARCSQCQNYQWITDPEAVAEHARLLATQEPRTFV